MRSSTKESATSAEQTRLADVNEMIAQDSPVLALARPRAPRAPLGALSPRRKGRGQAVSEIVHVLGVNFNNVTPQEVFGIIDRGIRERQCGYVVTANVDHVCRFYRDPTFRKAYRHSFLVVPDGVPLIWVSHLLGRPLRAKISGSDLVVWLPEYLAERGYSLFLLGAAEGVAAQAARALQQRHPRLRIAGTYSPPMGFENDPKAVAEAVQRVRAAKPDVCFVALGSPKQEVWMHDYCGACGVPVMIGIGAGLDFVAGTAKRAPRWIQNIGCEWLWRLSWEPRRLWRRYLIYDSLFLMICWRALRDKRHRAAPI